MSGDGEVMDTNEQGAPANVDPHIDPPPPGVEAPVHNDLPPLLLPVVLPVAGVVADGAGNNGQDPPPPHPPECAVCAMPTDLCCCAKCAKCKIPLSVCGRCAPHVCDTSCRHKCEECGEFYKSHQHMCAARVLRFFYASEVFTSLPVARKSSGDKNGAEWHDRIICLRHGETVMQALHGHLRDSSPLGLLFRDLLSAFLGVFNSDGFFKLGVDHLDRLISRNFTDTTCRRLFWLMAEAADLPHTPPSRLKRSARPDPPGRSTFNTRSLGSSQGLRGAPTTGRHEGDREAHHDNVPPARTSRPAAPLPSPPATGDNLRMGDFFGKNGLLFLCFLVTIPLFLPLVTAEQRQPRKSPPLGEFYFQPTTVAAVDTAVHRLSVHFPFTLVTKYLQQISQQLQAMAGDLGRELDEIGNIANALDPKQSNITTRHHGSLMIVDSLVTHKQCSVECLRLAGTMATVRNLVASAASGVFFLDILADSDHQRIYADGYDSIPDWKRHLLRLLIGHDTKLAKGARDIITQLPHDPSTYTAQYNSERNSVRLIDASFTGSCACQKHGNDDQMPDLHHFFTMVTKEVELGRQELNIMSATLAKVTASFGFTHAMVVRHLARSDLLEHQPAAAQVVKRDLVSTFYHLFGLVGQSDLRRAEAHLAVDSSNIKVIDQYLHHTRTQTHTYRARLDKFLTSTEQQLINFSSFSLFQHIRSRLNTRRLSMTTAHRVLTTQLAHAGRLISDYRDLAHSRWPQLFQDQFQPHLSSIELVHSARTSAGSISFTYVYRKLLDNYRAKILLPLAVAANASHLVHYNPREVLIFQSADQPTPTAVVPLSRLQEMAGGYSTQVSDLQFSPHRLHCSDSFFAAERTDDDLLISNCRRYQVSLASRHAALYKVVDNWLHLTLQDPSPVVVRCNDSLRTAISEGVSVWPIHAQCDLTVHNRSFHYRPQPETAVLRERVVFLSPTNLNNKSAERVWDSTANWLQRLSRTERDNLYKLESLSDEGEGLLGLGLSEVEGIGLLSGSVGTILLLSVLTIIIACCPCCTTVRQCIATCCQMTLIPGCRLLCSHCRSTPQVGTTSSPSPSLGSDGTGPLANSAPAAPTVQRTPSSGGATRGSSVQLDQSVQDTTGYGGSLADESTESDRPVRWPTGIQVLARQSASLARDVGTRLQSLAQQDRPELRNSMPTLHAGTGHPISHYLGQNLHQPPPPSTYNPLGQHATEMQRLTQPAHNPLASSADIARPTAPPVVAQPRSGRFDAEPLRQFVNQLVVTQYSPKSDYLDIQVRCSHDPTSTVNYLRVDVGSGHHDKLDTWCKLCEEKFRENGFSDFVFDPVFLTRLTAPGTAIRHHAQLSTRLLDLCHKAASGGVDLNSPSHQGLLAWAPFCSQTCRTNRGCSNCIS